MGDRAPSRRDILVAGVSAGVAATTSEFRCQFLTREHDIPAMVQNDLSETDLLERVRRLEAHKFGQIADTPPEFTLGKGRDTRLDGLDLGGKQIRASLNGGFETYDISEYGDIGAAINQALRDGAGRVEIPEGTWSFSTNIEPQTNGQMLVGAGAQIDGPASELEFTGSGSAIDGAVNQSRFALRDLIVSGAGDADGNIGIEVNETIEAYNVTVRNIQQGWEFNDTNADGTGTYYSNVIGGKTHTCSHGFIFHGNANSIALQDHRIGNMSTLGVRLRGGSKFKMRGGSVENCSNVGLDLNGAKTIRSATIQGVYLEVAGANYILLGDSGTVNSVTVEECYLNTSDSPNAGIRVDQADDTELLRNRILGSADNGIQITANANRTVLAGLDRITGVTSSVTNNGTNTVQRSTAAY